MANKFNKRVKNSGMLSKSGFRYNISKNCRWTADDAKSLPKYREGFQNIDWSKDRYKDQKQEEG